ncbi:MAG: hypothetical protein JXB32_17050 [Deltaproteobacteria bacterium]|nr:hypothetical protein [Deltaproteobacteria bacterium]
MRARRAMLALLALLMPTACRKPAESPADAEAGPPAPTFVAAASKPLELPGLQLRLEAPENLAWTVDGDTLRLEAAGFPGASIRVVQTETIAAVGGGGRCDERLCRYVYTAPCRELTCEVRDPGEHVAFVPALCGSLRSTYQPPTTPAARVLSTGGTHGAECDERQLETTQALDGPIAELLPRIDACWQEHAGDDPAWTTGEVNVRLERRIEEGKERTYRLFAGLSGLEGDTTRLQECLDGVILPLRGRLPAIVDADCTFAWDHRFLLDRTPSCPPPGRQFTLPADAGAAPDDGGAEPTDRRAAPRADAGVATAEEEAGPTDAGTEAADEATEPTDAGTDEAGEATGPDDAGTVPTDPGTVDAGVAAPVEEAGATPEGDTP